jgi:hypothetical protein
MADREAGEELVPSQRRLQRAADFTGERLDRFAQVAWRHGVPGLVLGAACLLAPGARAMLSGTTAALRADPSAYAASGLVFLAALVAYTVWLDRRVNAASVGWVLYLLCVSVWEEWVFRLALPELGTAWGLDRRTAVLASNLLFGLAHYFTLRWRWGWCVLVALGGLGLSRQLSQHHDLALLVGWHWVATVINTPRPPGRRSR